MRIDKIELCNLASLEGVHTIDFTREPLRSAGLFAITGNTGAGKSTILDAICLGLYGRAPRFENGERFRNLGLTAETEKPVLSSTDVRNILRRGQTAGYSRITFSLPDGSVYEASWSVRQKRTGTFDSAQRGLRKLFPRQEEYDPREIAERLAGLIHLTYEQFTRTVILAQNSFANFLHAKQAEKSLLLENLTGTEEFGHISRIVYDEAAQVQKRYDELLKKLEGIGLARLDEEALTRLKETLTLQRGQMMRDETALKGIEEQLHWYDEYNGVQEELGAARKLQFEAQRAYNSLYDKKQQLERYDSVLPFQPLYHTIKEISQEISRLKEQVTQKQKELNAKKLELEQATQKYSLARNKQAETQNMYDHKLPQFNQGHSLEGEIMAMQADLQKKQKALEVQREAVSGKERELSAKQTSLRQVEKHIEDIRQRQLSIAMHKPMVENIESIKVQLNRVAELEEESVQLDKSQQEDRKDLQALKERQKKLEDEHSNLESELSSLKDELRIHDQANHGLDSTELQQRFSLLSDLYRRSRGASNLWKRIAGDYSEIEEKENEIRRREISLATLEDSISALTIRLSSLTESRNVLRASYMLSQSDNIKELRRNLREGNACPVCGATHHPYHSETELELGRLLSDLEKNYQEAEGNVQSTRDRLAEKQQQLADEQGRLLIVKDYFGKTKEQLERDLKEWKDYEDMDQSFKDCSPTVNRQGRSALIMQLLDNTERDLKRQAEVNAQFNRHQEAINNINLKIRRNTEIQQENFHSLSSLMTEKKVIEMRIADIQKHQEQNAEERTSLLNEAEKRITVPLWQDMWVQSHDTFLQKITALAEEWNESDQKLQQTRQEEFKLHEESDALLEWLGDRKGTCAGLEQEMHNLKQAMDGKRQQMRLMFGEQTPTQAQKQMQELLQAAVSAAEESRKAFDAATEVVQKLQGEFRNIEQQQKRRETELFDNRSQLDYRIARFNDGHSTLQYFELEKLFSEEHDWQAVRTTITESYERLRDINYKVETASEHILELQKATCRPSESPDETQQSLKMRHATCEKRLKETAAQLAQSETRLGMHEDAVKRMDSFEAERVQLEQEACNWDRLNRAVGSADGKRFREIAQCYTFEVLIGYANRHLRSLTDRYRLKARPGTLWVDIIDRDMLSQVRGVNSLSGGETFIVSLALALGLASLSPGGSDIDSLFIDEGFGNLDSGSLDLVISALEGLQSLQGRKVGVISHTEQVRTRISPQIHLLKSQGGRSRIEIK